MAQKGEREYNKGSGFGNDAVIGCFPMAEISIFLAFAAGLLSFFSPCLLPILPGFVGFLSGSVKGKAPDRLKLFLSSCAFVIGFGAVFMAFGLILNGVLGGATADIKALISRIGGALVILFGLFVMGVFKVGFLEQEHKIAPMKTRWQYLTSALFGATFAAGWSPCVGAVLGGVLTLAATDSAGAFPLMLAFTAGLGVPFLFIGGIGTEAIGFISKFKGAMKYYNLIVGFFLVVIGLLMATGLLPQISSFFAIGQLTGAMYGI